MKKWSKDEIQQAIYLYNTGCTKIQVADKLNKSEKAIRIYLNKLGLYFKNPSLVDKIEINCGSCNGNNIRVDTRKGQPASTG